MDETVEPIGETAASSPLSPHGKADVLPAARGKPVVGHVVAVHRQTRHHDDTEHRLDVSVGGGEHTEVVVRVESGPCNDLEGKRVIVYVDE